MNAYMVTQPSEQQQIPLLCHFRLRGLLEEKRALRASLTSPRVLVVKIVQRSHRGSVGFVWDPTVIRFRFVKEGWLYGMPVDLRVRDIVYGEVLHLKDSNLDELTT
ncbi:hypothetical protein Y032_0086g1916 [Ancylostoma ceylanicum]|uniref:Uncharacterized protein n=1 Tax=Ancylostoma ceylanicum TaxID=53326 RepID=A0A016TPL4_9BILA|nr:hypothetical protein Y032_0086g1916 [Ancylostoma ceylanicum]